MDCAALSNICTFALMLNKYREDATNQNEVNLIVEYLKEHEQKMLNELYIEVPKPEAPGDVYLAVEKLLIKYSRRALNIHWGLTLNKSIGSG